ncbi:MAG: hypothetical protein D6741_02455 [Planctomycetota bacterium]|nr:MAG: hypothetical protein D6741_02455 [Planctomycetota bacterium]
MFTTAIFAAGWANADDLPPKPNVIVFLADDMGLGDTSAYQDWTGNPDEFQVETPAMERLAARGVRFTDAHSPSSLCSPTRYTLLTGRYCWRSRLKYHVLYGVQCDPILERERVTLPEFLQRNGYRTGMVGKWHLGVKYRTSEGKPAEGWDDADLTQPLYDCPLDHGFDYFVGFTRSHPTSGPDGDKRNTPQQRIGPGWIEGRRVVGATGNGKQLDGSYRLHEIGAALHRYAMRFLESAAADDRPFFLYFASPANHLPHTPSEKVGGVQVVGASRFKNGEPTNSARYDFIYQNDVHVAHLLRFLEETPDPRRPGHRLIENTVFVFSSDNGAERNDKHATGPLRSNKGSLYEGGHRIPLIVSWPAGGIGDGRDDTPGKTCTRLAALTDLYATIVDILGKPLPPVSGKEFGAEDSVSQLAAMRGEPCPPRIPLFPNNHKEAARKLSPELAWVAVRSNAAPLPGQWKLLLDHRFAYGEGVYPKELYNLADDPMEQHNLIDRPEYKPVVDFLTAKAKQAIGDDGSSRNLE